MAARARLILIGLVLLLAGCAAPRDHAWIVQGPSLACAGAPAYAEAAAANAASLDTLAWSPFGAEETGWRTYAPHIAHEIGTDCDPASQGFAARLAVWQGAFALPVSGRLTPGTFDLLKAQWQTRRPFFDLRAKGICPDPPPDTALAHARADETAMGKPILMTPGTLKALKRMRAAARRELDLKRGDPRLLAFSAFRSPAYDEERCQREQNCNGVVRAQCSAHRTGTALDLDLGSAPGYDLDASASPNRLYQTSTPVYRWLLARAARYGFVNYVFEPWHWEWMGDLQSSRD